MTAYPRLSLLLGALVSLGLAVYGAKEILGGLYDPILRAVGA